MSEVEVIDKIVYYSILEDLTYKEYQNFEAAKAVKPSKFILKQIIGYIPFGTADGRRNYASTMHLINLDETDIELVEQNDWKFKINSCAVAGGYAFTVMYIDYTDSFGNTNQEGFNISIDGFVKAYRQFERLNKYKEYKLAKVAIENEDLKIENQSQKALITTLTSENKELKERLSELA